MSQLRRIGSAFVDTVLILLAAGWAIGGTRRFLGEHDARWLASIVFWSGGAAIIAWGRFLERQRKKHGLSKSELRATTRHQLHTLSTAFWFGFTGIFLIARGQSDLSKGSSSGALAIFGGLLGCVLAVAGILGVVRARRETYRE